MAEKTSRPRKSKIEVCAFKLIFPLRDRNEMELPEWEGYSFELARALVDAASRNLANAHMPLEEKSKAMRLSLGFHWTRRAIRAVGAAKISGLAQRAMRHPCAKEPARKWRAYLYSTWPAPPELAIEEPRKW